MISFCKKFKTGDFACWTESTKINHAEYKLVIRDGKVVTYGPEKSCVQEGKSGKLFWIENCHLFNSTAVLKDKYNLSYMFGDDE